MWTTGCSWATTKSGRDHLLLDADPRGERPLVLQRHRRRVLEGEPRRIEDGDVAVGGASFELAGDDLADLANDVVFRDHPFPEGNVDLAVGAALADVVDEDAGPLEDFGIQLLVPLLVRPYGGDVRALRDPVVLDDRTPGRGNGDDDVRAAHDLFEVGRCPDLEAIIPWLLVADELVQGRLRAAPDADV